MKIVRVIDGKTQEIELTWQEVRMAYLEEADNSDREDVRTYAEWFAEDDERFENISEDEIARAAVKYRKWLDEWEALGEARYDFARDAILEVIEEEKETLV